MQLFSALMIAMKSAIRTVWGAGERFGLTGQQFGLLMRLSCKGPMSPTELSESLVVSAGNITGLIARLQKQHLVERRRSASDRRSLRIAITPAGSEKLEEILPWWKIQVDGCFSAFNKTEKKELLGLLRRLCVHINPDEPFPWTKGETA